MILAPETQQKAQEELDKVVSRDRLPELDDLDSLPYVNALCKEVLRWYPVTPFGLPHVVIEEDEYKGMRIPQGSILLPNVW